MTLNEQQLLTGYIEGIIWTGTIYDEDLGDHSPLDEFSGLAQDAMLGKLAGRGLGPLAQVRDDCLPAPRLTHTTTKGTQYDLHERDGS